MRYAGVLSLLRLFEGSKRALNSSLFVLPHFGGAGHEEAVPDLMYTGYFVPVTIKIIIVTGITFCKISHHFYKPITLRVTDYA